jgi:penicillin-binding protein 2
MRVVLAVQEHREDFPGVQVDFRAVREYPAADRRTAAHVLGYLGPVTAEELATPAFRGVRPDALVGRSGVEQTYDAALRGHDGVEQLEVDASGTVTGRREKTAPEPGSTLVLSIDAGVQQVAERALRSAVDRARATPARGGTGMLRADSGAVVVLDARTGRVVALASEPSYDPTVFIGGVSSSEYAALVDQQRGAPLLSRPVQGAYAPASTFKVVSTAAAVQSGDYSLSARYPCPGAYAPLGGKRNFEGEALGDIDFRTALVYSCDTFFYKVGYEQWLRDGGTRPVAHPRDPIATMAEAFGLGRPTGVDLPGERSGVVPDRGFLTRRWEATKADRCAAAADPGRSEAQRQADREFCADGGTLRGGDAANLAVGQGDVLITPLQLATVYAAVANGGTLLSPRVARALVSADGRTVTDIAPQVRGRVPVDASVLAYERAALAAVTTQGTAAGAFAGFPLHVAGKTGTGEVGGRQDTSWFASFAPAEDPQLVVVGMVSQGGTGATTAAPLVRDVYAGIWGLDGQPAALPGGRLPDALPPSVLPTGVSR